MPTGNLRRVVTEFTGVTGGPYYMVGHFQAESGTAQDCIDAWHSFTTGDTGVGFPTGVTVTTQGEVTIFSPVTGDAVGVENGAPLIETGTGTDQYLPPATQALIRWRTGNYVNGREVRGRTFFPLMSEGNNDAGGTPNAALVNALNVRAGLLIEDDSAVHVIWSKTNGVWWATQTGSMWNKWAVLRSRRD